MPKPSVNETLQTIRANVLADRAVRAVQWCVWAAIVGGLVMPLAWDAYNEGGAVVGLAVAGLCLALCWHVKPQGSSYGARVREIEARYPKE